MERLVVRKHSSAVSGNVWVHPVLIDIAIEHFSPRAMPGKTDAVVETVVRREVHDYNDVVPLAFNPAMEG